MRGPAFKLLSIVILTQLFIAASVPVACIVKWDTGCAQGKVQEHFAFILTQAMALYAAEK